MKAEISGKCYCVKSEFSRKCYMRSKILRKCCRSPEILRKRYAEIMARLDWKSVGEGALGDN